MIVSDFKSKAFGSAGSSFFMQYLSLILIILVFTIGAFLRGSTTEEPVVVEELALVQSEKKESSLIKTELSSINYDNLFISTETAINTGIAEALVTFLKSHDVESEIILSPESEAEADYNLTLGRGLVLSKYLSEQAVPRDSWHVIIAELPQASQAIVNLIGVKENNELL